MKKGSLDNNAKFAGIFFAVLIIILATTCYLANAATYPLQCGQTLRDKRSGHYYKAPACPAPCPTPKPCPSCPPPVACPTLAPTPVPTQPLIMGNKTVCASGCTYTTIQSAVNVANPGDVIQVKNGIYTGNIVIARSGTKDKPITLMAYPGGKPIIDPGANASTANRLEFRADNWILDGFEIRNGWQGVMLRAGNNTVIRNNWIHNNRYDGIIVQNNINPISNLTIQNNLIENNGGDACIYNGVVSPRHCHGFYISTHNYCLPIKDVKVMGNTIKGHGGGGININNDGCEDYAEYMVIDSNTFETNAIGISFFLGTRYSIIQNNSFILDAVPNTNEGNPAFLYFTWSPDNIITNNIFQSKNVAISNMRINNEGETHTVDYNKWTTSSNKWNWNGVSRNDFKANYKTVTGWDKNGYVQ